MPESDIRKIRRSLKDPAVSATFEQYANDPINGFTLCLEANSSPRNPNSLSILRFFMALNDAIRMLASSRKNKLTVSKSQPFETILREKIIEFAVSTSLFEIIEDKKRVKWKEGKF